MFIDRDVSLNKSKVVFIYTIALQGPGVCISTLICGEGKARKPLWFGLCKDVVHVKYLHSCFLWSDSCENVLGAEVSEF